MASVGKGGGRPAGKNGTKKSLLSVLLPPPPPSKAYIFLLLLLRQCSGDGFAHESQNHERFPIWEQHVFDECRAVRRRRRLALPQPCSDSFRGRRRGTKTERNGNGGEMGKRLRRKGEKEGNQDPFPPSSFLWR